MRSARDALRFNRTPSSCNALLNAVLTATSMSMSSRAWVFLNRHEHKLRHAANIMDAHKEKERLKLSQDPSADYGTHDVLAWVTRAFFKLLKPVFGTLSAKD